MTGIITEFSFKGEALPIYELDHSNVVTVAAGVSAAASLEALSSVKRSYRFICDVDCFITFSEASPAATTEDVYLEGGQEYFFVVDGGLLVSAVSAVSATTGTLNITPLERAL